MAQSTKGGISINKVEKYACVKGLEVTDGEMAKINALTIKELTADDVFIFKVAMCDNDVDRDYEYFPADTLVQMAELFKGKTVISDHKRMASNQVARIYDTEACKNWRILFKRRKLYPACGKMLYAEKMTPQQISSPQSKPE